MTTLENDNLDEELENIDLTDYIKEADWISPRKNIKNAGRKKIGRKVTLILPEETIEKLNLMSKEKGLGYQTLARMFIMQKVEDELTEKKKAS